MKLDESSIKPLFLQIAEIIEDMILEKEIKEDEQVVSTNQLAQILNINPATARKGLSLLSDEGILYKKRGLGMYVSENAVEKIRERRVKSFFDEFVLKMLIEAEKLNISKSEILKIIEKYGED
jgi:DNA-binding transcriptional regulator YhcF (GntR family)